MMLMDVTLRESSYISQPAFSTETAAQMVQSLVAAGIAWIEVGYFSRRSAVAFSSVQGASVCDLAYLERLSQYAPTQLVLMVRPNAVVLSDYDSLLDTGVKCLRFAVSPADLKEMQPHIAHAKSLNFKVAVNLIRVSEYAIETITDVGHFAQRLGADWFYLADSNGALFPDAVKNMLSHLSGSLTMPIGFHAHDGLSLAFINTVTALQNGASIVDGSLAGLGKGSNLSLELIAMYESLSNQASYDIVALCEATQAYVLPYSETALQRNENALAAMLNLNLDQLTALRAQGKQSQTPFWRLLATHFSVRNQTQSVLTLGEKEHG